MIWLRDNIAELEPYVPGFQPKEDGFVKLNTNENPYPPSPRVAEAIGKIPGRLLRLYPDPDSLRLRDRLAAAYGFSRDNVIVGNGSDELLAMMLRAYLAPGEVAVMPTPSYSLFRVLVRIQGGKLEEIELDDEFKVSPAFIRARAKIKFLASPNSPTGTVYSPELVDEIVENSDGPVIVDEAYVDFADNDCLSLVRKYPQLLITRTFSKSFALAGARVGYGFASEEIVSGLMKVKDSYNLNRISALAAEAALDDAEYHRKIVTAIKNERDYLRRGLENLGFRVHPSGANFLLAEPGRGGAGDIYRSLLERKILIRYFESPRLNQCLRISVGRRREMKLLLDALGEILS